MRRALLLIPLLLLLPTHQTAYPQRAPSASTQRVTLKSGTHRPLTYTNTIRKIEVVNPKIVDVSGVTRTGFTLDAKSPGRTYVHVILSGHRLTLDITVTR